MNCVKIETVEVIFISCLHLMLLHIGDFHENPHGEGYKFLQNIRENKRPTRCNRLVFLFQNLLFAQHVSGNIMPIIRSSRVIHMAAACGAWLGKDGKCNL